jgi:hypothetical protein
MENAKILAMRQVYLAEIILNVVLTIIELYARVPMDSKENLMLSASDTLVIKMMTVKRTKNVVLIKCVEIHVWSKELVGRMHNVESQIKWLIVLVRLDIMEIHNSNVNPVSIT